jgi:ABC-2 type transport system ATP-binding protein
VQVDGDGSAIDALTAVSGVHKVAVTERHAGFVGYEIEAEMNRDVRRDVARAIVDRGWGLLELRPMRMSLEEIFLQLTTEEHAEPSTEASNG